MTVIIEGIDGTGKTTLVKYLKKHINYASFLKHCDPPSSESQANYQRMFQFQLHMELGKNYLMIWDRSSLVSGSIYYHKDNKRLPIEKTEIAKWQMMCESSKVIIVHCTQQITENATEYDTKKDTKEQQNQMAKHYVSFMQRIKKEVPAINIIKYNCFIDQPVDILRKINKENDAGKS